MPSLAFWGPASVPGVAGEGAGHPPGHSVSCHQQSSGVSSKAALPEGLVLPPESSPGRDVPPVGGGKQAACLVFLEPFRNTRREGLLEKTCPVWMATAFAKPAGATRPALSNSPGMFFLLGFASAARAAQRRLSSRRADACGTRVYLRTGISGLIAHPPTEVEPEASATGILGSGGGWQQEGPRLSLRVPVGWAGTEGRLCCLVTEMQSRRPGKTFLPQCVSAAGCGVGFPAPPELRG